jgi:hypothetical protein
MCGDVQTFLSGFTSIFVCKQTVPFRAQRQHGRKSLHFALASLQGAHEFKDRLRFAIRLYLCRSLDDTMACPYVSALEFISSGLWNNYVEISCLSLVTVERAFTPIRKEIRSYKQLEKTSDFKRA